MEFKNCLLIQLLFFFNLFCFGVQPINNVIIVSGGQQRDSAICIHVSILLQTPIPSMLPHNIEQSSMCYTVGSCGYPFYFIYLFFLIIYFEIIFGSVQFSHLVLSESLPSHGLQHTGLPILNIAICIY